MNDVTRILDAIRAGDAQAAAVRYRWWLSNGVNARWRAATGSHSRVCYNQDLKDREATHD
jgi:hypothetical protein